MINSILLILIALSLTLGQIARINLGEGVQFYLLEVFVSIHVIILLRHAEFSFLQKSRLVRIGILWFGYVVALFLITAWGKEWSDNLRSGLYIARIGIFALYAVLLGTIDTQQQVVKRIWNALSLVVPVICLLQYVFLPDLRFLQQFGWDPHMYRAVGVFLDPPIVGALLATLFISALYEKRKVALILNYMAVVFLYSRSTYLAVFLVIILYLFRRKKWALTAIWVVFFSISVWLAPKTIPRYSQLESAKIERVSTVLSRRVEIEAGIRAWMSQPIFGIGFNRVAEYKAHHPELYGKEISVSHAASAFHSFWVTQLATTGIMGLILLVYWYVLIIKRSELWLYMFLILGLIGLLDNVLFHPFVLTLLLLVRLRDREPSQS